MGWAICYCDSQTICFLNKILITGGSGFLGGYLLKEFAKKDENIVATFRNSNQTVSYDNVNWIKHNILIDNPKSKINGKLLFSLNIILLPFKS